MADATAIIAALTPATALATWAQLVWPEWVPPKVRQEVADFWSENFGRSPADWLRSVDDPYNGPFPRFGDVAEMYDVGPGDRRVVGRYVHCWNNIGRLIGDEGAVHVVSGRALEPLPPPPEWRVNRQRKAFVTESGNLMRAGCHHSRGPTACGGCYARLQVLLDELEQHPSKASELVAQVRGAMKREGQEHRRGR